MANFTFRARDEAAMNWIDDCVERADKIRKRFEPQWHENWSNYRVESFYAAQYPDKQYPLATGGRNRFEMSPINFLKTPESHQGVNTLRALLLAGLFGTRDYVVADPVGGEDVAAAQKVSKLVMFGLERPGNFRTNFEVLGDGLIFGLGSYSARWRKDVMLVPRRFPVPDPSGNPMQPFLTNPDTGSIMTVLQNVKVPVFDDPVLETDDLWDTWYDPSANRFDEVKFKCKRFRIRDEELQALMEDENWDAAGIAAVLETEPLQRAAGPDMSQHPKLTTENLTLEDVKDVAEYGYYGGWMFEGRIPKEIADELNTGAPAKQQVDCYGSVVIRMVNGIVIQSIQSQQRNGRIQGGTITILPTGRGLYGLSPLTVVRYLQDVSDTQLILTVQALIESVYQNYLTGGEQGPNFARDLETRRPREVFTLQGEVNQVVPLPKDYSGLQIAVGALNLMSQTIRNAMNARDPVQGIMKQSGNTTATETQVVASAALQNTDQLAVLIERDELPVMGRLINDLYYINLDDESKVIRRVGEDEATTVNYFDIDCVSDINFVGARSVMSKQAKASQFRDFATMLASNPFTAAATDWHALVERYGNEAMDLKGLSQLMLKDPEEIIARMQAAGLANTVKPNGGAPVGGTAGGPGPGGGAPPKKGRSNPVNGGGLGAILQAQGNGEPQ